MFVVRIYTGTGMAIHFNIFLRKNSSWRYFLIYSAPDLFLAKINAYYNEIDV